MARSVVGLDIGSAAVSGTEVRLGGGAAGHNGIKHALHQDYV